MSYEKVKPQDFMSDSPPERIIGTECEYNIQQGTLDGASIPPSSYIDNTATKAVGLRRHGSYLGNGAKLYVDLRHLEYASAEERGPHDAAAADLAGVELIRAIVAGSGLPHRGIYRMAGSSFTKNDGTKQSETSGYHENYLLPRSIATSGMIHRLLPGFLASRLYSMSGMITDGFVFSQKVWGIGGKPVIHSYERQTRNGKKPMAIIRDEDNDTVGNNDWTRLEIRFADPGISPSSRMLTFGATSLLLRMIEHPQFFPKDAFSYVELVNPVEAAKRFARDLTMKVTQPTRHNKYVTLLDISETFGEIAMRLCDVIELPEDEVQAAQLWVEFNDAMRAANPSEHDYGNLVYKYDFAIRHHYLASRHGPGELHQGNPEVVARHLGWDRIEPQGGGVKWWSAYPDSIIEPEVIASAQQIAPATRASIRADIINNPRARTRVLNWATIKYIGTSKRIKLDDSYQDNLAIPGM